MTELIKHNTPIEEYFVNGKVVYVKREDLSTISPPMPALAKMRGASRLLAKLKEQGVHKIGVYDTHVSRAGIGITCLCNELDLTCYLCYPNTKKGLSEQHEDALAQGAIPHPIKGSRTPICYAIAKREITALGGYMLPQGLVCHETVEAVAEEANSIPLEILGGSVVACTGTGTIISGICTGLPRTTAVFGVSACISVQKQLQNISNMVTATTPLDFNRKFQIFSNLKLIPQFMDYYEQCEIETPFPCSPYYDKKAWKWMIEHIDELAEPILFWNIGQK